MSRDDANSAAATAASADKCCEENNVGASTPQKNHDGASQTSTLDGPPAYAAAAVMLPAYIKERNSNIDVDESVGVSASKVDGAAASASLPEKVQVQQEPPSPQSPEPAPELNTNPAHAAAATAETVLTNNFSSYIKEINSNIDEESVDASASKVDSALARRNVYRWSPPKPKSNAVVNHGLPSKSKMLPTCHRDTTKSSKSKVLSAADDTVPPPEKKKMKLSKKREITKEFIIDHTYHDFSQVDYVPDDDDYNFQGKSGKEPRQPFPAKLHAILSNPSYQHIICWQPHGRAWIVLNSKLLSTVVCPNHFRHAKFESFNRSVNNWGFKRLLSAGSDCKSYYHECFLRGRPDLTKLMERKKNQGKRLPDKDGEPNFYKISKNYPLPKVLPSTEQEQEQMQCPLLRAPMSGGPGTVSHHAVHPWYHGGQYHQHWQGQMIPSSPHFQPNPYYGYPYGYHPGSYVGYPHQAAGKTAWSQAEEVNGEQNETKEEAVAQPPQAETTKPVSDQSESKEKSTTVIRKLPRKPGAVHMPKEGKVTAWQQPNYPYGYHSKMMMVPHGGMTHHQVGHHQGYMYHYPQQQLQHRHSARPLPTTFDVLAAAAGRLVAKPQFTNPKASTPKADETNGELDVAEQASDKPKEANPVVYKPEEPVTRAEV